MSHGLRIVAALTSVGVSFVDGVKIRSQADLPCAQLCDRGADRSMSSDVCVENCFFRSNPESDFVVAINVCNEFGSGCSVFEKEAVTVACGRRLN